DEVLADHARRDRRQLHTVPLAPAQEPPHRPLIRPLRVRIVMLGIEEFLPGEAGCPPGLLDQRRQLRAAARSRHADRRHFDQLVRHGPLSSTSRVAQRTEAVDDHPSPAKRWGRTHPPSMVYYK